MKKIGIMTDSHSGILSEEAQRLGIKVLPMPFYIGEKVYREGVDLSRDEFYDRLIIVQAPPAQFVQQKRGASPDSSKVRYFKKLLLCSSACRL